MGNLTYPLTERIKDDISVHGLHWATQHHWKKWGHEVPTQFRILMRSAVLY